MGQDSVWRRKVLWGECAVSEVKLGTAERYRSRGGVAGDVWQGGATAVEVLGLQGWGEARCDGTRCVAENRGGAYR